MAKKNLKGKTATGGRNAPATVSTAKDEASARTSGAAGRWTFLTNHSHVLLLLARNPSMVLREVATRVGITERAVQRIIAELEEEGFIKREKVGRQNQYQMLSNKHLRHPIEAHCTIDNLIQMINESAGS